MASVKVPELLDGVDLRTQIQRSDFETRLGHIVQKIDIQLDKILASKHIVGVSEVEFMGGGIRVPMIKKHIQTKVKDRLPEVNTGTHMNSDESMALGAGYIAANYSSEYKVKKVFMYQKLASPIRLNLTQCNCTEDCFQSSITLFKDNNFGTKKKVSITKYFGNMDYTAYDENGVIMTGHLNVMGVSPRPGEYLELTMKLDKSGILQFDKFVLAGEEGAPKGKESELGYKYWYPEYNPERRKERRNEIEDLMAEFDELDRDHRKYVEARTKYETLIYSSREWANEEENDKYFKDSQDKDVLLDIIDSEEEWFENEGYDESVEVYKERRKAFDDRVKQWKRRKTFRNAVKKELKNLKTKIEETETKFDRFLQGKDWYPEDKKEEMETFLEQQMEYYKTVKALLKEEPITEIFSIRSSAIVLHIDSIDNKLKELKSVEKPKKKKKVDK